MKAEKSILDRIVEFVTEHQSAITAMVAVAVFMTIASAAQAMVAPIDGEFGYTMYDIGFNKVLSGAGGWLVGGAGLGIGLWQAVQQRALPAICAAVGTGGLLKLESLLTSFGMLLQ